MSLFNRFFISAEHWIDETEQDGVRDHSIEMFREDYAQRRIALESNVLTGPELNGNLSAATSAKNVSIVTAMAARKPRVVRTVSASAKRLASIARRNLPLAFSSATCFSSCDTRASGVGDGAKVLCR
jgi:hypothetical protein